MADRMKVWKIELESRRLAELSEKLRRLMDEETIATANLSDLTTRCIEVERQYAVSAAALKELLG